jgi:hypothetical protein
MSKIAAAIEEEEEGDNDGVKGNGDKKDNIFINELLMYHKRLLHDQIDNLMKSKKKYAKNIFRYRMMLK